jgi:hypothetical protein
VDQSIFRRDKYGFGCLLRDILIEHLDGSKVDFRHATPQSIRRRAIMVLLERRLIEGDDRAKPTWTVITYKGRRQLAKVLADYAEALIRAGNGDLEDDASLNSFESIRTISLGWIAAQRLEEVVQASV